MKNKLKRGFTLIELLVVITIIAILAGIAVPAYNGITGKARQAEVLNNTKQIVLALKIFASENGGSYPIAGVTYDTFLPGSDTATEVTPSATESTGFFDVLVPKYLPEKMFSSGQRIAKEADATVKTEPDEDGTLTDIENCYSFVKGISDSSNGGAPLVSEELDDSGGMIDAHPWLEDGKVIVAFNDGSAKAMPTDGVTAGSTVKQSNNSDMDNIFADVPQGLVPSSAELLAP